MTKAGVLRLKRKAIGGMLLAAVVALGVATGAAVAGALGDGGSGSGGSPSKTFNQNGVATDTSTAAWMNSLPDQVPVPAGPGSTLGYVNKSDLLYPPTLVYGQSIASQLPKTPGSEVHDSGGRHLGWFVPDRGFMTDSQASAAAGVPSP